MTDHDVIVRAKAYLKLHPSDESGSRIISDFIALAERQQREAEAYKQLSELLDRLLVCYQNGKRPTVMLLDIIYEARAHAAGPPDHRTRDGSDFAEGDGGGNRPATDAEIGRAAAIKYSQEADGGGDG